jgi:hypothetical protein
MEQFRLRKRLSRHFLSALVASVLCLSGTALADDCGTTLQPLFDFISTHFDWSIPFNMVTNRVDSHYVSYTTGYLRQRQSFPFDLFADTSSQTFSDRFEPPCDGGFPFQNFYVNTADSLGISVDYFFGFGGVYIHNNTWGGDVSFAGTCFGTMIYGTMSGGFLNGDTMAVISFGDPIPNPR